MFNPDGGSQSAGPLLWQLGVGCSRFLVNEAHCVADEEVDVPQVHALAGLIEPENMAYRYPGACWRYLFVGALNVFEVVSDNVHQLELKRLLAPLLTEICAASAAFVSRAIDGVEDRHASKVGEPD